MNARMNRFHARRGISLPLPVGEGWGEGSKNGENPVEIPSPTGRGSQERLNVMAVVGCALRTIHRLPRCAVRTLLFTLLFPLATLAGESEALSLLQDLRPAGGAAEFRYEETRVLELVAEPWHGWGYLFSSADGSLVKLQMFPQRAVMAISGGQMLYYDREQNRRRSAPLGFAGAAQRQITAFRSILQGRIDELRGLYELDAERKDGRWILRLIPKAGQTDAAAIEMTGEEKAPQRTLKIREAGGESSEYRLEKTGEGQALELTIQRLLLEAAGESGE